MALDAFLDSNGLRGVLISNASLRDEERFDSILSMPQLDQNMGSHVLNSTILGRSSAPELFIGHDAAFAVINRTLPAGTYLQRHSNTTLEHYINHPMTCPSDDGLVNVSYNGDVFSQSCLAGEEESDKQNSEGAVGSTNLCKTKCLVRMQPEHRVLAQILKKPRLDVNQGNIHNHQQETIEELLLKELQDGNPQLKAIMQQSVLHLSPHHRRFHLQMPKQLPEQKTRILLHDQCNQQETFAPLLDGGICSQRLKQYLYHMRNGKHDNGISYWKKFVAEYYAPGSKKRWCFSKYENIELHSTGVFCPRSMGKNCCEICGLKSGKGLEATSEMFPRLFKMKFESGMLDEILYIDSPRAHKVPEGLVLEHGKAVQASVYEKFRVVHNGKLRVVFRHDLKILSWEFCIENHEEYLVQSSFTPQVKQLVQAVDKYNDIRNCCSRASLLDLQRVCDMCVSAGIQIARNMEIPLVNDLGYPKQFIRCLQISEVVDSMKDIMAFSQITKMGAIECLNNYSRGRNLHHQGLLLPVDDNQNSSGLESLGLAFLASSLLRSQSSESGHQSLVDKMFLDTMAASRG